MDTDTNTTSNPNPPQTELLTDKLQGDPEVIALIEQIRREGQAFDRAADAGLDELEAEVDEEFEETKAWEDDTDEQVSAYVQDLVSEDAALPDITE